jgi:hypothetical protein
LAGLFDGSRAWRSESWPQHLVRLAALLTGVGLVGRALLLSQDWLRGWGGAFYMGTVGGCIICCVALSTWGHLRGRVRVAREYALHTCALLLLPVTFHGLEAAFLGVGFPYEDAFLSAGVVASSFNLSMSYYYTVYAARRGGADRQPRPVIGATLAA